MSVHLRPEEIEAESFRIIDAEAGEHTWPPDEWSLVRRVIHTSADFEYAATMCISPGAVEAAVAALRAGGGIVTDTNMAAAGIGKERPSRFGSRVVCLVGDPEVAHEAKERGVTRSIVAMRRAASDPGNSIFVIGNAPTALFELLRLVREEGLRPALVVALPVGFVGAVESKDEARQVLADYGIPHVANRGRKGGSNVAAAVLNALLLLAGR